MEGMDPEPSDGAPRFPPYIRLVWSNPVAPRPRRPLNLAVAIERHIAGEDGLTDEQFVTLFAKG